MSNVITDRITHELSELKSQNLLRTLDKVVDPTLINCSANSYLNLQNSPEIDEKAKALCATLSGNGASRLVQEVSPLFEQLESQIAQWKGTEKALLFNSGYIANVSIIQALATPTTTIFCDRLNHASIIDGIRLSRAKLKRYNHCDIHHLHKLLEEDTSQEKIVITDTVFSMDGTVAPLEKIADLCDHYDALLMVDEAHRTGVFGEKGSGIVEAFGLEHRVALRMGTLSKAISGVGGFVACSQLFYDFLSNKSRGLIYSTALPPSTLAWNSAAIEYVTSHKNIGLSLLKKAAIFKELLEAQGIDTGNSRSQIIPIIVGSAERALDLSAYLKAKGYSAPAIRPPTVSSGSSRVRVSLHLGISDEQITDLAQIIIEWHNG